MVKWPEHDRMTGWQNGDARSPLVLGVILLVIGAGLLAAKLGYSVPVHLWRHWPWILIVPGLLATVLPSRHMSRSGGVWLLATGIYGLCGMYQPFGLGWSAAWPIFIIAAGFSVIFNDRHREPPLSQDDPPGASRLDQRLDGRFSNRATHDE